MLTAVTVKATKAGKAIVKTTALVGPSALALF